MGALIAFESAARHGNFSRAARELNISQPAISRQIASLEKQLTIRLFERSPEGVTLTDAGTQFWDGVVAGLSAIHEATVATATRSPGEQVVIACSGDTSYLYMLPRHQALQEALGESTVIRILTYHDHHRHLPPYPLADVVLSWEAGIDVDDYVVIREEAAGPVCSPEFAAKHKDTLRQPVSRWSALTFLDVNRPNLGWPSWDDWFRVVGYPEPAHRLKAFDSCGYVLDAAAHGHGIAMGWRDYVDNHLESGKLTLLTDGFVEFGNRFCGMLTPRGRGKPIAQRCLEFLAQTG